MSSRDRVLVAMSGGVDSSVAAALLLEAGYDVVGVTMKTWDFATSGPRRPGRKESGCCSLEDMNDARSVALRLGFPHLVVDLREEFGDGVIARFTAEYLAGRTPNPCVLCNTHIKWAALLRRADALGCRYVATGHYARLRHDAASGRYVLSRGRDRAKDQSYALWGMPQEHLARTLLPLGSYTKAEIRRMAAERGLDRVADKPDSYEICFVPDDDYRAFLKRRVPGLAERVAGGRFVRSDGTVVGQHEGYPFYTIGQRRGLGLALGEPVYVTAIDPATNTVTVGPREELERRALVAREPNFVAVPDLRAERAVTAQVRYRDPGAPALAWQTDDGALRVVFATPRLALTPGQAVVLYDGDDVLAGAWIHAVGEEEPDGLEPLPVLAREPATP